jgi:filamin
MAWIDIQQNTFTNWTNDKLKPRDVKVDDLVADLNSGIMLCHLVELLVSTAQKKEVKVGKVNRNPKMFAQKLENASLALKLITDDGVKLVNIGNEDIVNGSQKLILGLIWTLIQKYQISLGVKAGGKSPKAALLDWVNAKLKSVGHGGVTNFNKDWNSGVAVCALVNACGGGLPDWSSQSPGLTTAQKGISGAKDNLDIPDVLAAKDMINPDVDDLSVMTYISYFTTAKPGKAAPVVKAAGPEAAGIKVAGRGIESEGVAAGDAAPFVATQSAPFGGQLTVKVDGPKDPCQATVTPAGEGKWNCEYTPKTPGVYLVHVKLDAVAVPGSPFKVTIPGPAASAAGEGISKGTAKQPAAFCIKSNPPSPSAKLVVTVDGPGDDAAPQVKPKGDGSWDCTYTPTAPGEYTIAAKLDGEHITGSPWKVTVDGAKERKGPSLGYENKIVGFYSTTTSSQVVRSNTTSLQNLLESKGVHMKNSFVPWTPVDVDMTKETRDKIFEKADGKRMMPMLFVDDEYIGSYDEVLALEESGKLDAIINAMP